LVGDRHHEERIKQMKILAAATLATALLVGSAANAAQVYQVQAWTQGPIPSGSNLADALHTPAGPATASFTWTGPIDWRDDSPQNTDATGGIASSFLDGFATQASGYSGTLTQAAFLASSLTVAGDAWTTFFKITSTYSSPTAINGSFSHDDGATVYVDGILAGGSAGETVEQLSNYTLAAGTHNLALYYVAGNGTPSVLNFSSPGVPEPASWALMLLGFGGLGAVLRHHRRQLTLAGVA
jgi:hypothetical protein